MRDHVRLHLKHLLEESGHGAPEPHVFEARAEAGYFTRLLAGAPGGSANEAAATTHQVDSTNRPEPEKKNTGCS